MRTTRKKYASEAKPHIHGWDIIGVNPEESQPYHPRMDKKPESTVVLLRCGFESGDPQRVGCGEIESRRIEGIWTFEQLEKNHAVIRRPDAASS